MVINPEKNLSTFMTVHAIHTLLILNKVTAIFHLIEILFVTILHTL
jgi:hypothetical protein